MDKPSGNITFLFTDIEGSARLSQKLADSYQSVLKRHNALLKDLIESHGGSIFKDIGDAICSAFQNAPDAVKAACEIQKNLLERGIDLPVRVRVGIHTGIAKWNGTDYEGYMTLTQTNRIMSVAYGGQILISDAVYANIRDKSDKNISYRNMGERRLKDLIEPVTLYQILSQWIPNDFPPLKTLDARPNNLPLQLNSFIGREKEMSDIKKLLNEFRLITLLGPGGTGKTRLSLETASGMADEFADGVMFIALDSLFDPGMLLQTIAQELSVTEQPDKNTEDTIFDYLRGKEMLLILDNCEHLIEACSKITSKLLQCSPKLKIIATSREALRIAGEHTYQISSLAHPDPEKKITPALLRKYEAVILFIERAQSAEPDFVLNEENALAISNICFRLDGIPLAIELAAARVKVMSPEKISEKLKDRFRLLTGGSRTALPRQQTLKALVDWSYELLTEHEKIVLNRLSAFTGGWTPEAAEYVCSDNNIDRFEIFETLNALLEKSLIVFDRYSDRYRMLETIKQYCIEKLDASDDNENVELKHMKYFIEFSEEAEPELSGSDQNKWLEKIEKETANLNEALAFSLKQMDREYALRLSGALGNFWIIRGYFTTGRIWYKRILDDYKEPLNYIAGKALNFAARLAMLQGDIEYSKKLLKLCLEIMTRNDDKQGIALALKDLGSIEFYKGEIRRSIRLYEDSLLIYRQLGNKSGISSCLNNLGNSHNLLGDLERALHNYEECLILKRESGDKRAISNTLINLGVIFSQRGNYKKAMPLFEESLMLQRERGDKSGIITCLINMSNVLRYEGEMIRSKELAEEGLLIARELGEKQRMAQSLLHLGRLSELEKDNENAKKYYEESIQLNREISNKHQIAISLVSMGSFLKDAGKFEAAINLLNESLMLFRELGNKNGISTSLVCLGSAAAATDNLKLAKDYYTECILLFQKGEADRAAPEIIDMNINVLINLSDSLKDENDPVKLKEIFAKIENSIRLNKFENGL